MRRIWFLALVLGILLSSSLARAAEDETKLPDLLSLGTGWFDVFKHPKYTNDADIRLEHRWGLSMLSLGSDKPSVLDPYFQIHPFVGVETTPRGNTYVAGGLVFDFLIGRYLVFSPNFGVGIYSEGGGKRLGSPVEFRSSLEAGFRFPNEMRLTAYCSHSSNAELTRKNPGAEMMGGYLHIPFTLGGS